MTSGNLGGEPIVTDDDEALERLAPLADGWLHARPADPRAVRRLGRPGRGRRASCRSAAPAATRRCRSRCRRRCRRPSRSARDLKNTCAVAEGRYAWLSQHIGDMDDLATLSRLRRGASAHLRALTGVRPDVLVADAHPATARPRGRTRARRRPRPVRAVQHHHAHIAAVMAEHGLDGRRPGDRGRLRRHRLRHRRRGLGRRGAARRLQGLHRGSRTWPTCRWPAATPACRGPTGWRWRTCGPPACDWDAGPAAGARPARRPSGGCCATSCETRAGLCADLQHGPAVRRGLLARRRPARRRLRGAGGDRAGGAVPRRRRTPRRRTAFDLAGRRAGGR